MKKAIVVTLNKYPDCDAGAVREHAFAKLLCAQGYFVDVFSMGASTGFKFEQIEERIKHVSLRSNGTSKLTRALDYILFAFRMRKYLLREQFDVCLYTEINRVAQKSLKRICKKNHAFVIFDAVEWYSPEEFKNGENNFFYKQNNNYNTQYVDETENVIAISQYLAEHFTQRKVHTIKIPVIMDVENTPYAKDNSRNDKVIIMYAGSPGKKDKLSLILEGIDMLSDSEKQRLEFIILGCNEEELIAENQELKELMPRLDRVVQIKGRMPRQCVFEYYQKSDFSIFARSSDSRYAKAGFPTKFVESMATATPVICNDSSDLSDYLVPDQNGILISDLSAKAIAESISRVLCLNCQELSCMKQAARKTALEKFDYRNYSELFKLFVNEK